MGTVTYLRIGYRTLLGEIGAVRRDTRVVEINEKSQFERKLLTRITILHRIISVT